MNKDKIKKALTCCKEDCCSFCPHWCEKGCQYQTLSDALDLITEQEKEIEQLTEERNRYAETLAKYQMASDKEIMAQKKQAVKEFAEKLKDYINDKIIEEFFDMAVGIKYFTIDIDEFEEHVDELLEEYENDT